MLNAMVRVPVLVAPQAAPAHGRLPDFHGSPKSLGREAQCEPSSIREESLGVERHYAQCAGGAADSVQEELPNLRNLRALAGDFFCVLADIRDLELGYADLQSKYEKLEADFTEILVSQEKLRASHKELQDDILFLEQDLEPYHEAVLQHLVDSARTIVQATLGIEKREDELWADYFRRVSRDNFPWFVKQGIFADLHLLRKDSDAPFQPSDGTAHMERIVQCASVSEPGWERLWQLVARSQGDPSDGKQ